MLKARWKGRMRQCVKPAVNARSTVKLQCYNDSLTHPCHVLGTEDLHDARPWELEAFPIYSLCFLDRRQQNQEAGSFHGLSPGLALSITWPLPRRHPRGQT